MSSQTTLAPTPSTAAIVVLAYDDESSRAALVGTFDRNNAQFLSQHLDELTGDVVLECDQLDGLDEAGADVLLDFWSAHLASGSKVLFRGIRTRCRTILIERAIRNQGGARIDEGDGQVAPGPPVGDGGNGRVSSMQPMGTGRRVNEVSPAEP